ncbi:MAG: acyl-CoA desaturase [Actinomycetota bacterium]|nr:acyl-CoA desaturase [Actinomycetota bacterium]
MTASTLTAPRRGSEFAELFREVKQAGLLNRTPVRYAIKITLTVLAFAGGWVAFGFLGDSWWQLGIAAFLGLVFTQIGFLGHDAGHRQIFRSQRANQLAGLLQGNLLIGLSFGWWVTKHNQHHGNPNQVGKDPDIGSGAILFTEEQAADRTGVLSRLIGRYQAFLFFPMLLLEGLNLHVASLQALRARPAKTRLWEAALLLAHLAGYLTAVLLVLSPWQALAFIAVQQGLFGLYMGLSFAPNHKGMPMLGPDQKHDFLRAQVLTARNVRGGPLTDFALGGLNYQVEHHLFPSMPRFHLRRAQPIVVAFCARHGVNYVETSLVESYRLALGHLHHVADPLRA